MRVVDAVPAGSTRSCIRAGTRKRASVRRSPPSVSRSTSSAMAARRRPATTDETRSAKTPTTRSTTTADEYLTSASQLLPSLACIASRWIYFRVSIYFRVTVFLVPNSGLKSIQSTHVFKSSLMVFFLTTVWTDITDLCTFVPFAPCSLHFAVNWFSVIVFFCYNGWPAQMGFMHFWQPSTLCFDPVRFHICIVVLWRINLLFSLSRSVQFSGETPGGLWAHVEY